VLTGISPTGVLTGFGRAPAHDHDRSLAEEVLAQRRHPQPALPSAGVAVSGTDVADQGFGGQEIERRVGVADHARLICPPQPDRRTRGWPKRLRQWLIGLRQPIEAVHRTLIDTFRLDQTRPHAVTGALAALAATAAIHHGFMWLNRRHGRPHLATAEVFGW
jgi:hypothetical protein